MLNAAIVFLIIALVAMLLGFYGVAGISFDIGLILLIVFVGLALLGFIAALVAGRRAGPAV